MYRQVSVVLILLGLAIAVYAFTASAAFGDEVQSLFVHLTEAKWVMACAAGLAMSVLGIIGVTRDRRERQRRAESGSRRRSLPPEE